MRRLLTLLIFMTVPLARPGAGHAEASPVATGFGANDVAFLNLMGDLEAPEGFGDVFDGVPILPPERLEAMTIGEVLAYQQRIRAVGTASSAVGRYQFIQSTLQGLVVEQGIAMDLVFDGEVQTYLARVLMADCGFYEPERDVLALADCLASVWAALPVVTGPHRGRSAYAEDGLNRALTRPETILGVLESRFAW